jgi:hypothetical protein
MEKLKEGKLTERGNPGKLEGTVVKRVRGRKVNIH